MKRLLVLLSFCLASHSLPAGAKDSATEAALKEEVLRLRGAIVTLSSQLNDMQKYLTEMNRTLNEIYAEHHGKKAVTPKAGLTGCTARLIELRKRRDKLMSLGYTPEHPDSRNIRKLVAELEAECGEAANQLEQKATEKAGKPR